jgi:hypothetical protein
LLRWAIGIFHPWVSILSACSGSISFCIKVFQCLHRYPSVP